MAGQEEGGPHSTVGQRGGPYGNGGHDSWKCTVSKPCTVSLNWGGWERRASQLNVCRGRRGPFSTLPQKYKWGDEILCNMRPFRPGEIHSHMLNYSTPCIIET